MWEIALTTPPRDRRPWSRDREITRVPVSHAIYRRFLYAIYSRFYGQCVEPKSKNRWAAHPVICSVYSCYSEWLVRLVVVRMLLCYRTGTCSLPRVVIFLPIYWLLFFLSPITGISATWQWQWSIGVTFCMMAHIGPGQIFSPFWGITRTPPQIRNFWPKCWSISRRANISKTVSRSVTCQSECNISWTRAF